MILVNFICLNSSLYPLSKISELLAGCKINFITAKFVSVSNTTKGPFPLRAWKRAFFVSFIDLRLKRAVKIEASAKKKQ